MSSSSPYLTFNLSEFHPCCHIILLISHNFVFISIYHFKSHAVSNVTPYITSSLIQIHPCFHIWLPILYNFIFISLYHFNLSQFHPCLHIPLLQLSHDSIIFAVYHFKSYIVSSLSQYIISNPTQFHPCLQISLQILYSSILVAILSLQITHSLFLIRSNFPQFHLCLHISLQISHNNILVTIYHFKSHTIPNLSPNITSNLIQFHQNYVTRKEIKRHLPGYYS